ncbi:MAG: gliding motility-associated C-terminal domain-containing protein, partial [Flavobacteriales bacterium]|nr:gliding motility-associated C-terminal domain-containing protein [Flavobacteriales bacterium]
PIYDVQGPDVFTVSVIGSNGCIGLDEVEMTINPNLEVFSGFTPDNGDGVNDEWLIGNRELFPAMVVSVYNRWGDQLFISEEGYPTPWNGTYENKPLPVGTYYYIIELNDPKFPDPITGPLTIFR